MKWHCACAGTVAPSFYLGFSRLFIVKSPLSGMMKMSDMPDNTGFPAVRPQQLGHNCSAFLHTYSVGKTGLPIYVYRVNTSSGICQPPGNGNTVETLPWLGWSSWTSANLTLSHGWAYQSTRTKERRSEEDLEEVQAIPKAVSVSLYHRF